MRRVFFALTLPLALIAMLVTLPAVLSLFGVPEKSTFEFLSSYDFVFEWLVWLAGRPFVYAAEALALLGRLWNLLPLLNIDAGKVAAVAVFGLSVWAVVLGVRAFLPKKRAAQSTAVFRPLYRKKKD